VPVVSPSTVTVARLTRCRTARTAALDQSLLAEDFDELDEESLEDELDEESLDDDFDEESLEPRELLPDLRESVL